MNDMYIAYSWLAVSAAGLIGFWLHLHYRRRDRMLNRSVDVERLEAEVRALQADADAMATETAERLNQLDERIDFAERLLLKQAAEPRRIPIAPDRIPTPV